MKQRRWLVYSVAQSRVHRAVALTAWFALLLALIAHATVSADVVGDKVITLGESNTEDERQQLLDIFEASPNDKVTIITVGQTKDAMRGIFDDAAIASIQSAYSSTALQCRELGDGLNIRTSNIEQVTPSMYALALVTAGIGDANLVVAAPPTVSGVRGLTALTGIFLSWQDNPCESGNTNRSRQTLAQQELALAADIALGTGNLEAASNTVLETQKTIINNKLTSREEIDAALAQQEAVQGIAIPAAQREELLDMFENLANANIDWSTFAKGWQIEYVGDNQIVMTGEGSAIRDAQASATAKAAAKLTAKAGTQTAKAMAETATAQAALDMTATAQAAEAMTATAAAQATQTAAAALTATFEARETATPVPTATPEPMGVSGTINRISGDEFFVEVEGSEGKPIGYRLMPGGTLLRGGKAVAVEQLVAGDRVQLVVIGGGPLVSEVTAEPAPVSLLSRLIKFVWIVPILLAIPAARWAKTRKPMEPFVLKRVHA